MDLYPDKITWRAAIESTRDQYQLLSKEKTKKIKKTLLRLPATSYRFNVEPVTLEYLARFIPPYRQHVASLHHPRFFDIETRMASGLQAQKNYQAISLYHVGDLIGGFIFQITKTSLCTAYRFFPPSIPLHINGTSSRLPASPSDIAESLLIEQALQRRKIAIWHGRDTNPYGPHSSIGLAQYKLGIGCLPHVSRLASHFLPVAALKPTEDTLIFLGEKINQPITQGILVASPQHVSKYTGLLNHPKLKITVRES